MAMELYGEGNAARGQRSDQRAVSLPESGRSSGPGYPERPGVRDCLYYLRTGFCGFGSKCRFNHPPVGMRIWVYPERPGEPLCQFYLRRGVCKFGPYCKFHHPKTPSVPLSNPPLNIFGFPLRPGERDCSYYLKTGRCKSGITCAFHHPQPAGLLEQQSARQFYAVQSLHGLSPTELSSVRLERHHPLLPGSFMPGAFGPVFYHSGVFSLQNWSHSVQGTLNTAISSTPVFPGAYSHLHAGSNGVPIVKRFPERPGQPECKYYLKTGNCKFGPFCKFHHPPDWVPLNSKCTLSPLGLPLRLGERACSFYLRKGFCKFGVNCKFDHPMETIHYNPSAASLTDAPNVPYVPGLHPLNLE